jgi:DnaK suppressor protein
MWYIPASSGSPCLMGFRERGNHFMDVKTTQKQTDLDKLESVQQELLEDIEHLQADLRSMAEPSADEADADAYEREKTWALVQRLRQKLESVERAMQLARNGTYGTCENCGQRIDPARLEIIPEATLCLDCQRKFERQSRRRR